MSVELVTLTELMSVTKLSPEEVIQLLEQGALSTTTAETQELLVDITSLTPEKLAARAPIKEKTLSAEDLNYLEELVGAKLLQALDSIVDDAIELASSWSENK